MAQPCSNQEPRPDQPTIIYLRKVPVVNKDQSRQAYDLQNLLIEAIASEIMETFDGTDSRRVHEVEARLIANCALRRFYDLGGSKQSQGLEHK